MSGRPNELRLVFAGGGTGGHLYPAIAIANRLEKLLHGRLPLSIHFVGTKRGIEYRQKDELGYPLHLINIRGVSRSLSLKNLIVPFLMVGALSKSFSLLSRIAPHMVIGTGGYVSWPLLKAAQWKKIPFVLQEQNSFPGIVTRSMAPKARVVCLGFAGAKEHLSESAHTVVTGNPVRSTISTGAREEGITRFGLNKEKKTILILGGSQGARSINQAVLAGLGEFTRSGKYQLLWQTGKRDYKDVVASAGENARCCALFPFENNMPLVYAASDIVIARAGALTLAELQECALPSILIPYPHAAGDHQIKNAREYAASGFAEVVTEQELELQAKSVSQNLLALATRMLENGTSMKMKETLERSKAGRTRAVDMICDEILTRLNLADLADFEVLSEDVG